MCSSAYSAVQRISPDQPFDGVRTCRIQAAHSAARGLNKPVADFAAVGDIRSYVRFSFCEKQGRASFSCKARPCVYQTSSGVSLRCHFSG